MAEQFKEMSPADVREQKMRDNMAKAADKARENSLGTPDKKATKSYDVGGKDFGDLHPETWKKGGFVDHNMHVKKHAAGFKHHDDHVKAMCGGGMTKGKK